MKYGVLGTGMVGQALAARLDELGQAVMIGTRSVEQTLARQVPDTYGNPPFQAFADQHPNTRLGNFRNAAEFGEVIINATNGRGSLAALEDAGSEALAGKLLIDIANPLDFSAGFPPTLFVKDSDSLAEQIQRTFPESRVVKTLNIVNAHVMVYPEQVNGGDHTMFLCGNDPQARAQTADLLRAFGWRDILDLGDLSAARGMEMMLPQWLRTMNALGTPLFNYKLVR